MRPVHVACALVHPIAVANAMPMPVLSTSPERTAISEVPHVSAGAGRRAARIACTLLVALASAPPLAAQVRPVIAVHGAYGDVRAGGGADAPYASLGALGPIGTGGIGVGLLVHDRFGFIAFGEVGERRIGGAGGGATDRLARTTFGARLEVPVARLPLGTRGLVATTLLVQQLEPVDVRLVANAPIEIAPPGATGPVFPLRARSLGARLEVGVERRTIFGTGLFVLAGVSALGAAHGPVEGFGGPDGTGGVSFAPIVTVGVRTRAW